MQEKVLMPDLYYVTEVCSKRNLFPKLEMFTASAKCLRYVSY